MEKCFLNAEWAYTPLVSSGIFAVVCFTREISCLDHDNLWYTTINGYYPLMVVDFYELMVVARTQGLPL